MKTINNILHSYMMLIIVVWNYQKMKIMAWLRDLLTHDLDIRFELSLSSEKKLPKKCKDRVLYFGPVSELRLCAGR